MKKVKRVLLLALILAMVLGQTLVASAASVVPTATKIAVTGNGGKAGKVAIYTNSRSTSAAELKVVLNWTRDAEQNVVKSMKPRAVSSDSNIAKARISEAVTRQVSVEKGKVVMETSAKLTITALKDGKVTVTVSDPYNKKKATVKVTVSTLAERIVARDVHGNRISVSGNGGTADGQDSGTADGQDVLYVAEKGSTNLVVKMVSAEGVEATAKGATFKSANPKVAAVNSKGVVTGKSAGKTTITITSKDKKVTGSVNVEVIRNQITSLKAVNENPKSEKDRLKTSLKIDMKSNVGKNTYETLLAAESSTGKVNVAEDLVFTSNKPSVAVVDRYGVIKAVGNGTANITVQPRLGNKLKVTYKVKVTTDVDALNGPQEVEVFANGKFYDLGVRTNANVTVTKDSKIAYNVKSVTLPTGSVVSDPKAVKKLVSVNAGKGTVKATQACKALIEAKVAGLSCEVTVDAVTPVYKILLPGTTKSSGSVKIIRPNDEPMEYNNFMNLGVVGKNNAVPKEKGLTFASNNKKVATVDPKTGQIKVVGNGSAVITAAAIDGSKVKATLKMNVQTYAYELHVNRNSFTTIDGEDVMYVEEGVNTSLAGVVNATVNKSASKQGVDYYVNGAKKAGVKLSAGEKQKVRVVPKFPGSNKCELTFQVLGIPKSEVARNFDMNFDKDTIRVKKGASVNGATALVKAAADQEGKKVLHQNVTWSTKDSKLIKLNKTTGEIIGKAEGTAKVTATYTYKNSAGKKTKKTAEYKVVVGRSDDDVIKELNDRFTYEIKSGSTEYLGAKAAFDAKQNAFDVDIVDPEMKIKDWEGEGLREILMDFVESVSDVAFTSADGQTWSVSREGLGVTIIPPTGEADKVTVITESEGIAYLKKNLLNQYATLEDWNGSDYQVAATIRENGFVYNIPYTLKASIKEDRFESMMDEKAEAVAKTLMETREPKTLADAGIKAVSYDPATNIFSVDVMDSDRKVVAGDAAGRKVLVDSLLEMFRKATNVEFTLWMGDTKAQSSYDKNGEPTEKFIQDKLDIYLEKPELKDKIYNDFANYKMMALVTYTYGSMEYTGNYTLAFNVGKEACDYSVDTKIANAIAAKGGDYGYAEVKYAAEVNEMTVLLKEANKNLVDLEPNGIGALIRNVTANDRVTKAVVIGVKGNITTMGGNDFNDTLKLVSAMVGSSATTNDLAGRAATIKVTYDDNFSINYTVAYDWKNPEQAAASIVTESEDVSEGDVSTGDVSEGDVGNHGVDTGDASEGDVGDHNVGTGDASDDAVSAGDVSEDSKITQDSPLLWNIN